MALFLLSLCFFLSGFAALLYETAWTREFATVFGTSELAVSAVLAAYMAGLALGAALAARFVQRLSKPVFAYGVLELGIGLGAIAVPFGISALSKLYVALVGGRPEIPEHLGAAALAFQLGGTFAVLIPCAAMMGATLPLLARHAVRREEEIGPRIGLLYAVNTAGAIAGTLCAAFVLLPRFGLRDTIHIGAALNALVFAAAALLSRAAPAAAIDTRAESSAVPIGARWVLAAVSVSGVISFSQEVLWFRLLGHIFGGSTPAFASMLASFLAGIAIGSAAASRFAKQRASAALGFALVQLGIGLTAWISFHFANLLPNLANAVGATAMTPLPGLLVAGAALLPMTLCIGASFPFAVRLHAATAEDAAAASARVYAWNTLGSIVGAVGAGYVLLPVLGLAGTLLLCTAGNLALAAASALVEAPRRFAIAGLALGLGALIALVPVRAPHRLLVNTVFQGAPAAGELAFVGVGRSATVTLMQSPFSWRIQTNGLPEAGVYHEATPPERARETAWLGFLPLLARPDAKHMLIVGLGGASTLASVPSAFESVDVIELEPEVVEANRRAAPRRGGDPFAHPRVKLHLGDARGALVLTDQRFDAIVSQPSHPWTSGASHLYTREFFDLVRQHLTPGGVFVQWIGIQFLDDELLRGMLTTLLDVFPHLEVYRPLPAVLIFAGSEAPLDTIGNSARTLAQHRDEWRDLSIRCPEDVAAALVLTTAEARALAGDAAPNRDDHNRLASGAHIADGAQRAIQALVAEDPIARLASGLDLARLSQRLTSIDLVPRVQRLAQASRAADRELVRAWAALTLGRRMEAARSFEQALSAGASAEEIASGLRLAKRADGEVAGEPASARALAAGWRAEAVADWPAVAQLDPLLAVIAPPDPLFPEVARLRARARLAESGTAAGEAALEILRPLLLTESSFSDFLLWGRAAAKAGQSELAWAAIDRVSQGLTPAHAALRRETVELMDRLPEHPQSERIRAQLRRGPH